MFIKWIEKFISDILLNEGVDWIATHALHFNVLLQFNF